MEQAFGKLYGSGEPVFEEGDVFKAIISVPKGYSIKGESDGRSKVRRLSVRHDTEKL